MGRGRRDHRCRQCLHGEEIWTRPRRRLLAHSRHVDGLLRGRQPLSVADRRRVHELLRLVLRPAARHRRRPGASRPTCRKAPTGTTPPSSILWGSNVPQTRTPDAHFYTEVRYKGAKSVVICPDYAKRRNSPIFGCIPNRAPTPRLPWPWVTSSSRNSISPAQRLFRGLLPAPDRPADAGGLGQARRGLCPRIALCGRPISTDALGQTNNPEWKTLGFDRTDGVAGRAERLDRLPLGRKRQVEHRREGCPQGRRRPACSVA